MDDQTAAEYDEVIADLRAENERLRKDAERWEACMWLSFPIRVQYPGDEKRQWVVILADGGVAFGESPADAIDAAIDINRGV